MTRLAYRLAAWDYRHHKCLNRAGLIAAIYLVVAGILGLMWR